MLLYSVLLLCVVLIPTIGIKRVNSVEKYFNVCRRDNPKIEDCVRNSIETLRPRLVGGINEIGIPPLEPLQIPEIKLEEDTGAIALYSSYTNISIHGLSKSEIREIKIDLENNYMQLKVHFPSLELNANYKISGKIMMMPLQGEGLCNGNFTDVDVTSFIKTGTDMRNGKEHLTVEDIGVNFEIGSTSVNLDNLFNGDQDLGSAVNKFLNENWQSIMTEIKPTLEDKMAHIIKLIAAKLFETFSYAELLPP